MTSVVSRETPTGIRKRVTSNKRYLVSSSHSRLARTPSGVRVEAFDPTPFRPEPHTSLADHRNAIGTTKAAFYVSALNGAFRLWANKVNDADKNILDQSIIRSEKQGNYLRIRT